MGKATTILRLSHSAVLLEENNIYSEREVWIQKEVDAMMKLMPKGTEFVKCRQQPITDLSLPYLLEFEHPWFQDGTTFELTYCRIAYVENDRLKQENLMLGIRYTKPDGSTVG